FCGKLAGVQIHDLLEIECGEIPERGCSFGKGGFSIHHRKFPILGAKNWVGNWCWDSVEMEPIVAADFISFLLAQRGKHKSQGLYAVWQINCAYGDAAIEIKGKHDQLEAVSSDDVLAAMGMIRGA